jgi:hypothetical protein
LATDGLAGVTAIDCSVAAVIVMTVEPVIPLRLALIVLVPTFTAVAKPPEVMVAALVVADAQVTVLVRFCVLLSEKVPVAVNCRVSPLGTDGMAGVTAMDCSVAAVTVMTVEPVTPLRVALMVLVPLFTAVARPPGVMVAALVVAEAQVTVLVRF